MNLKPLLFAETSNLSLGKEKFYFLYERQRKAMEKNNDQYLENSSHNSFILGLMYLGDYIKIAVVIVSFVREPTFFGLFL